MFGASPHPRLALMLSPRGRGDAQACRASVRHHCRRARPRHLDLLSALYQWSRPRRDAHGRCHCGSRLRIAADRGLPISIPPADPQTPRSNTREPEFPGRLAGYRTACPTPRTGSPNCASRPAPRRLRRERCPRREFLVAPRHPQSAPRNPQAHPQLQPASANQSQSALRDPNTRHPDRGLVDIECSSDTSKLGTLDETGEGARFRRRSHERAVLADRRSALTPSSPGLLAALGQRGPRDETPPAEACCGCGQAATCPRASRRGLRPLAPGGHFARPPADVARASIATLRSRCWRRAAAHAALVHEDGRLDSVKRRVFASEPALAQAASLCCSRHRTNGRPAAHARPAGFWVGRI